MTLQQVLQCAISVASASVFIWALAMLHCIATIIGGHIAHSGNITSRLLEADKVEVTKYCIIAGVALTVLIFIWSN